VYYVSKIFHGNTLDPHTKTLHPDPPEGEVLGGEGTKQREGRKGGGASQREHRREGKKGGEEGKKGMCCCRL